MDKMWKMLKMLGNIGDVKLLAYSKSPASGNQVDGLPLVLHNDS